MIDNLNLILPLLNFDNEGDFYMLYVFKRKKDQPEGEKDNHQSVRTIKTYCIESIEHLKKHYEEIKQLCEMFKARAYIHIQKQNHKDISLDMLMELAKHIKNQHFNQKNLFDSVVGQIRVHEKRWIVDIDTKEENYMMLICSILGACRPFPTDIAAIDLSHRIIEEIPTKNGFHLITTPFDVNEFNKYVTEKGIVLPDIQKKNPTLLYLPNSLN